MTLAVTAIVIIDQSAMNIHAQKTIIGSIVAAFLVLALGFMLLLPGENRRKLPEQEKEE